MPRITNETQLTFAMQKLQAIFYANRDEDVATSRQYFNDWADSYGNKTLLFQSLYTKGIPINDLAKWLSPTQNQGQVRNAVVKINDVEYIRGVMGRYVSVETFKAALKQGDANTSLANAYAGSIRYWWENQGGNQQRVVRTPSTRATRTTRTTTPSEPTRTNGGTTQSPTSISSELISRVLSVYTPIVGQDYYRSDVFPKGSENLKKVIAETLYTTSRDMRIRIEAFANTLDTTRSLRLQRAAYRDFLINRLLNYEYVNASNIMTTAPFLKNNILEDIRLLLQRASLMLLFIKNDFNDIEELRFFCFESDDETTNASSIVNRFFEKFKNKFGLNVITVNQSTILQTTGFNFSVKFAPQYVSILKPIGNLTLARSQPSTRNAPDTAETEARIEAENEARRTRTTTTTTASATAINTLVRDIPFTNSFGLEIEYFYPTVEKVIAEGKKVGIKIVNEGYTHEVKDYWKIVRDGSLSGTNNKEVVSPILRGKKGIIEMKKCLTALHNAGVLVNKTTGVHLHLGAKDLTLQTWKNLLFNYLGFQPIIDKMMATYRRNNRSWAMKPNLKFEPNTSTPVVDREWRSKVEAARTFRDLQLIYLKNTNTSTNLDLETEYRSSARYYAINLFSYTKHGTVEFRQHGGSIEYDTLTAWLLFMHYLLEVSKKKELTNFSFDNLMNFTPVPLHTWIANRIFDLSDENPNATAIDIYTNFNQRN